MNTDNSGPIYGSVQTTFLWVSPHTDTININELFMVAFLLTGSFVCPSPCEMSFCQGNRSCAEQHSQYTLITIIV